MDNRRVGVRAIIYKDGKLLAVRHKNNQGRTKDFWVIPGGGLDSGEALEAGLRREVLEELGVAARVGRLLFIQQFNSKRPDCTEELEFFFLVENPHDFDALDVSSTSHGKVEIDRFEFIDPKNAPILPSFLGDIDIEAYCTSARPVYVGDELGTST